MKELMEIPEGEAVVLNTCDEWKTKSTYSLVGVYTERKELDKILMQLKKEKAVEVRSGFGKLSLWDLNKLNERILYASLNIINLNEEA